MGKFVSVLLQRRMNNWYVGGIKVQLRPSELAKHLDVDRGTPRRWLNGSTPSSHHRDQLIKFFGDPELWILTCAKDNDEADISDNALIKKIDAAEQSWNKAEFKIFPTRDSERQSTQGSSEQKISTTAYPDYCTVKEHIKTEQIMPFSRRTLISGALATASSMATNKSWPKEHETIYKQTRDDKISRLYSLKHDGHISFFSQTLNSYRNLDDLLGPRTLIDNVIHAYKALNHEIDNLSDQSLKKSLELIAAEYCQFLGWLYLDLSQYNKAAAYCEIGIHRAFNAGSSHFGAYLMVGRSLVDIYLNNPYSALYWIEEAKHKSTTSEYPPSLQAWIELTESRVYAMVGRPDDFTKAIDKAQTSLNKTCGPPPPQWLYYFDENALHAIQGMALVSLRETNMGSKLIYQAIEALPSTFARQKAVYGSYLMEASIAEENYDDALRHGSHVLNIASSTGSSRSLDRIVKLRKLLSVPSVDITSLAHFDEHLTLATHELTSR